MGISRFAVFVGIAAAVIGGGRLMMHQPAQVEAKSAVYSNVATPHDAPIPQEALRLRIIANSDSNADQALKLAIRDQVVVKVGAWVKNAKNATQARQIVMEHIPQIEQTALQVEHAHGVYEPINTDVGKVPFPTKIYGNRVYPAGSYEALRITIGKGQGANWWCVLYPPLCFIDITEGDAVPNTGQFPDLPPIETIQVQGANGQKQAVQVRLATEDYGEAAVKAVKQLFKK
ncbi:stage II sporulation protein R [Alicyclobacillus dauci]|uniref:Stage II sporulation protein R n=1 Tax=Alicyclobacillus dauci TaxID=1475485 RepID=A0ABY6Z3U8_9BACL|nr:stage II sporulation protein R [Alicyclobacillus dauci]WAH36881.1 stage II sporulation protein R [Alicyclobacillus dauci]